MEQLNRETIESFGPAFTVVYDAIMAQGMCTCHYVDIGVGYQKVDERPDCLACSAWAQAMDVVSRLVEANLMFPPEGSERLQYGRMPAGSELIIPVADTPYGREHATHVRTVLSWVDEGPNDNWPRYNGPWKAIS